jgi:hypothetical protein
VFQLNLLPHALTTTAAYLCGVAALTLQGICVSVLFDDARGVAHTAAASRIWRDGSPCVKAGCRRLVPGDRGAARHGREDIRTDELDGSDPQFRSPKRQPSASGARFSNAEARLSDGVTSL